MNCAVYWYCMLGVYKHRIVPGILAFLWPYYSPCASDLGEIIILSFFILQYMSFVSTHSTCPLCPAVNFNPYTYSSQHTHHYCTLSLLRATCEEEKGVRCHEETSTERRQDKQPTLWMWIVDVGLFLSCLMNGKQEIILRSQELTAWFWFVVMVLVSG